MKEVERELLTYCWQLADADRDVERVTDQYVNGKATIREKDDAMKEKGSPRFQEILEFLFLSGFKIIDI